MDTRCLISLSLSLSPSPSRRFSSGSGQAVILLHFLHFITLLHLGGSKLKTGEPIVSNQTIPIQGRISLGHLSRIIGMSESQFQLITELCVTRIPLQQCCDRRFPVEGSCSKGVPAQFGTSLLGFRRCAHHHLFPSAWRRF